MDINSQKQKESESKFEIPWIPHTPIKNVPPKQPVIYTDRQENMLNQPNWLTLDGCSSGFTPEITAAREHTCFSLSNYNLDGEALRGQNVSGRDWVERGGMFNAPRSSNVSFSSLLALADAADMEAFPHQSDVWSNSSYSTEHHWRAGTAFSCQTPYQFIPVTPYKAMREECQQPETRNSCSEERTNRDINEQNITAATGILGDKLQTGKDLKSSVTDSSFLAVPTDCNEICDPDQGGSNAIDLNKTPQQKPRRKKHRPKVVTQDKPKRTPKTSTSEENPEGKRKNVRRKAPNKPQTTILAEPNGELTVSNMQLLSPNPAASEKKPTVKRTYVRRKQMNKSSVTPAEANGDPTDPKILEHVEKSCRRVLNFDMEGHSYRSNIFNPACTSETLSKSTVYLGDGVEVMVETTNAGFAFDLHRSVNQMLQDYLSLPEKQSTPVIPNGSNYSTYTTCTEEIQDCQSKGRKYPCVIEQQDTSSTNLNGIPYNALEAFQRLPPVPRMCKKRRTEKGKCTNPFSTSSLGTAAKNSWRLETTLPPTAYIVDPSSSKFHCWNSAEDNASGLADGHREGRELYYELQNVGFGLSHVARSTKKRSRDRTRGRNLASPTTVAGYTWPRPWLARQESVDCDERRGENSHRPYTSTEALLSGMHTAMTADKLKERVSHVNYASPSLYEQQLQRQLALYNQNQLSSLSLGAPKLTWEPMHSVNATAEELKAINRESSDTAYREQNALVPYQSDGTIVPFDGSLTMKKRRPRPKVNLDEETNRVWKLLLGNINSEGIDGTDEEKVKWWEEEREVFRGRANSFIARMHLVQGDRRFSPWKGSVVDSVVGVFLTQNVSDHLSSSAFMSIAAHFPVKAHDKCKSCYEEGTSSVINQPIVHTPDTEDAIKWNGETSNQSTCDQSSLTIHDIELDEEREVVSNESSRCSSGIVFAGTGIYYEPMVNISSTELAETGKACHIGDETAINDALSSQNSVVSSQNSVTSAIVDQTADIKESHSDTVSEAENMNDGYKLENLNYAASFVELLQKVESTRAYGAYSQESINMPSAFIADSSSQIADHNKLSQGVQEVSRSPMANNPLCNSITDDNHVSVQSQSRPVEGHKFMHEPPTPVQNNQMQQHLCTWNLSGESTEIQGSTTSTSKKGENPQNITESDLTEHSGLQSKNLDEIKRKAKSRRVGKEIRDDVDWDAMRKQAEGNGRKRERTANTMDSLDWEAVRCADVDEIAKTIKERGMNNVLAGRIKDFLNRLVQEHGSIDLEWLRDIPPDKAKEYLLSIRGLGLKSVECVRLLTLHHLAFPVDTNVGRIAVRLGWVPLQPLPESLQLHLLELYPVLESIQKYLWPRLCKLDQRTLYELHYQLITFGKVFCTKSKPNCNSCPMRGECRHFASAFASARLSLPGPEERGIVNANESKTVNHNPEVMVDQQPLRLTHAIEQLEEKQEPEENQVSATQQLSASKSSASTCVPIIEEPLSPEPECTQLTEKDMEDAFFEDPDEIPTINLDMEEFTQNLQTYMQQNMEIQEGDMSKALVALTAEAASIPMPKLKNVSRLRTEHQVYELPDYHPLLKEIQLDAREPDDPCSYLLAIWTPGEMANSFQPPERSCSSQENGMLCYEKTCFSCNSIREANSQTVRGTLLIPCRTAMRGSFPLNGTYFQVNEVFADHDSSVNPINVPREWIWNLPRRTVYFGTSIPTIFRGLTTQGIQHCFWRGHVCVRGFDRKTRAPRPLMARLHFPASKLNETKGKIPDKN